MKKITIMILVLMLIFSLAACGGSGSSSSDQSGGTVNEAEEPEEEAEEEEPESEPEEPAKPAKEEAAWEAGDAIIDVWTDSIGTDWIRVMIPVKNTGTKNLYMDDCSIDLEDGSGHLIDTMDYVSGYPQVLQPGETAWFCDEDFFEGDASAGVNALPHFSIEEAEIDCIRFEVSDLDLREGDYGGFKLTGRVENNTDEDQSMVYITAFLYDANGSLVAEIFDIMMDDLAVGDKRGFASTTSAIPGDYTISDIASYEVIAFPYQYQF